MGRQAPAYTFPTRFPNLFLSPGFCSATIGFDESRIVFTQLRNHKEQQC